MSTGDAVNTVLAFEKRINLHDVNGLLELFAPDGRFIDSLGNIIRMDKMQSSWEAYFRMVPDYRISHEEVLVSGAKVALFGTAQGTYSADGKIVKGNFWTAYASWLVRVDSGKVKEWRVYCDNEPIREVIRNLNRE